MSNRYEKWRESLSRTRKSTFGQIATFFGATELNADTWDELEALLVQADMGIDLAVALVDDLRVQAKDEGWTQISAVKTSLETALHRLLPPPPTLEENPDGPTVILIVGVNGSGKTTSVAKLAKRFQDEGKNVVLGAADTYRAAAVEQLQTWGQRLNIRVIAGQPEGDPGAVTYDTISSAVSRNDDIVMIDTAGRLHTQFNLMEELKKVYRVCSKPLPGAPHAVWLVMDATTGQNALQQAIAFKEAVNVTGVLLTKLDSSARGGMAFAIQHKLKLPILFAGLGEGADDLIPFDPDAFIEGILAEL